MKQSHVVVLDHIKSCYCDVQSNKAELLRLLQNYGNVLASFYTCWFGQRRYTEIEWTSSCFLSSQLELSPAGRAACHHWHWLSAFVRILIIDRYLRYLRYLMYLRYLRYLMYLRNLRYLMYLGYLRSKDRYNLHRVFNLRGTKATCYSCFLSKCNCLQWGMSD